MMKDPEPFKYKFVVALRFGSTKSGYAFSSNEEFLKGWPLPLKADLWNGGPLFRCIKMPTSLLLNPDKSFNSFGYDAESNFTDLVEEGNHREYFYFEKFTKNLYNQIPMLSDVTGKKLATEIVFSESLRFFKNEVLVRLNEAHREVTINCVKFIFILPSTWGNQNEDFIKNAAVEAGIEHITVAQKENVVPVYLRHFIGPLKQHQDDEDDLVKRFSKIMLLDTGGQRTEISVFKQTFVDNFKETRPTVVGPYGGKRIDDEFRRLLEEMWPGMTLEELKEESLEEFIELFKEFELKKCLMTATEPSKVSITLPITLIELIKKSTAGMEINEWLGNSPYPEVKVRRSQHLQIPSQVMEKLFQPTIDNILKLMQRVLNEDRDIQAVIMTGGFAKSSHLQRAVITQFQSKTLIIPRDPDFAILEGTVVFGHLSSELILKSEEKMELLMEDKSIKEITENSDEELKKDDYDEGKTEDEKLKNNEEILYEKENIEFEEVKETETVKENTLDEEETTDKEGESDQYKPEVSLFDLMKQKEEEKKQEQLEQGNTAPVIQPIFEQQVLETQKLLMEFKDKSITEENIEFEEVKETETVKKDTLDEDETTDEEGESDQYKPEVSLFDLMKQKEEEKKQEQLEQGNTAPVIPPTFEQQVLEAQNIIKVKPKEIKEIQEKIKLKYKHDMQGETEVTAELLEEGIGVNQKDKLSFNEVVEETIELDNKEINNMVLAAKQGNWSFVWNTLDKKPYLVNCIPEQRAWSALHQAIFHGGLEAVRKLVEDYEADIQIRTKPDKAHAAEPGTDALTMAKQLGRKVVYDYLLKYAVKNIAAVEGQDISYFRLNTKGITDPFRNYPLLQLTLASYKSLITPDHSLKLDQTKHLIHLLRDIFANSIKEWEDVKLKLCNTLYGLNRAQSEFLREATNKVEFYRRVIKVYMSQSNVYKTLNPAMVKQPLSPYKPLANDLAVGPFAIMLSAILFEWDELKPFEGKTYRGVSHDVTSKYKIGQQLLFLNFISSSRERKVAEFFRNSGTLFIIDNGESSKWGPREIHEFSNFFGEAECLYPLGAEFKVESVNESTREVHLKLISPSV